MASVACQRRSLLTPVPFLQLSGQFCPIFIHFCSLLLLFVSQKPRLASYEIVSDQGLHLTLFGTGAIPISPRHRKYLNSFFSDAKSRKTRQHLGKIDKVEPVEAGKGRFHLLDGRRFIITLANVALKQMGRSPGATKLVGSPLPPAQPSAQPRSRCACLYLQSI